MGRPLLDRMEAFLPATAQLVPAPSGKWQDACVCLQDTPSTLASPTPVETLLTQVAESL